MATRRHPRTMSGLGQTDPINTLGRHPRTQSLLGEQSLSIGPGTTTVHPRAQSEPTRQQMVQEQTAAGDPPATASALLMPKLDQPRRGRVRYSRPVEGRTRPSALLGLSRA